jgi:hypothetical protein
MISYDNQQRPIYFFYNILMKIKRGYEKSYTHTQFIAKSLQSNLIYLVIKR